MIIKTWQYMQLTKPLKSWKDAHGRNMYRLGDLPAGIEFEFNDARYAAPGLPRNTHTGKRQCFNKKTGKVEYLNCSKKVVVISKDSEN